jgi:hypothetical protein
VAKGGGWVTVPMGTDDIFSKPIKLSDMYGMSMGEAQRVLQWALKHGYPWAHITNRDNGLHAVGLNRKNKGE